MVALDGSPLGGSPFPLRVRAGRCHPGACEVRAPRAGRSRATATSSEEPRSRAVAGVAARFFVLLRDSLGNAVDAAEGEACATELGVRLTPAAPLDANRRYTAGAPLHTDVKSVHGRHGVWHAPVQEWVRAGTHPSKCGCVPGAASCARRLPLPEAAR